MTDPTSITTDQLRAAYDALGLDPERFEDVMRIYIGPDECAVERVTHPTPHERVTSIASIPFGAVPTDEPSFPFEVFGIEEPAPTEDVEPEVAGEPAEPEAVEEPQPAESAPKGRSIP